MTELSGSSNAPVEAWEPLRALARIGVAARGDAGELLARACELAVESLGYDRASVYRLLPSGEIVVATTCGDGETHDAVGGLCWTLDDRPDFRAAWQRREPVAFEDGLTTRAIVPLCGAETCLGFLAGDDGRHSDVRLARLAAFADVLAAFLEDALEQERLHRLNDLKSHFIALASHELRAPVSVIHGIGVTLNVRADYLDRPLVTEMHAILNEQTEHLAQLVNQLLDLSRLEANAIKLEKQDVRVRDALEEIVRTVAPEHAEKIAIEVPAELRTYVDPNAFERIVANLVVNAVRYGAPPITIAAQQRDTHFRLVVEDRGDGVRKDFVPRLFERFTRSDETAPKTGGSGLGLAIAHSYANAHGGELMYENAEPHGARFELVLPRPHPDERRP